MGWSLESFVTSKWQITLIVCVGYLVYSVLSSVYLLLLHPLAKYPGPKLWAISRIPWAYYIIKGDFWVKLDALHLKYGSTVRISPDELTTIDPNAWEDIYVAKPVLAKDPYSLTPPLNGAHSLFTAEGDTHRRLRGALVNGFAEKALRDQASIVEEYGKKLVARIRREVRGNSSGILDIQKLYGYAAFDTVTDLSFGESMHDTLSGDTDNDEIKRFFLHAKFSTIRNCLSRFSPLDVFLGLFLLGVTRKNRLRNWQLTTSKIERRLARGDLTGVRSDLLTPLVGKINENGETRTITKSELITNQLAFVIAACQLTTVALSTGTYFLMQDRVRWERLADEIRKTFTSDDAVTVQATRDLPYLNAVVNETMRIRHPTPISLPRCVPAEGRSLSGQHLPGNTIIGVNLQNIQTSPTLWVEPNGFHPERFLPQSHPLYETRFDADVKSAFQPFSIGARNCIGNKVYLAEARVFLAKIVWNFDLFRDKDNGQWLDQKAFLVFEPKELQVRLTEASRPSS